MNGAAAAEHLPADRGLPLGSLWEQPALLHEGSAGSQAEGANPRHCPFLPRISKAALRLFNDGDQTTGTCSWKKSGIL